MRVLLWRMGREVRAGLGRKGCEEPAMGVLGGGNAELTARKCLRPILTRFSYPLSELALCY